MSKRRQPVRNRGATSTIGRALHASLTPILLVALGPAFLACGVKESPTGSDTRTPEPLPSTNACSIPEGEIFDGGVGRGGIPELTDPKLVSADDPEAGYLFPSDRVIGVRLDDDWVAVPHNILWWHEVVNFTSERGGTKTVTYCPLTGSNLFFDAGEARVIEFIVSGLLFHNNLMMLDPDTESIWPQMSMGARCGPRDGASLPVLPSIEMTWEAWRTLHPDTRVISGITGFSRDYTRYPYGRYEDLDFPPLFPEESIDERRPIKERVLGIPAGEDGIAFPFLTLQDQGPYGVARATTPEPEPRDIIVFWDGEAESAMAYERELDGELLDFVATTDGFVDQGTGSVWRIDGLAVEGPLAGARLEPIAKAHVAFWFAWAEFHPNTTIWRP